MTTSTKDAALEASPRPAAAASSPTLVHLQILRALAATLVVVDHAIGALLNRGYPYRHYFVPAYLLGYLGVAAFFVLSGLIMVRQSSRFFGSPRGPLHFVYNRLVRIVPMYWIATLLWLWSRLAWHFPTPRPVDQLLCSLFFIPDYINAAGRMQPLLEQGWTLNYEMFFYLLFGCSLLLRRRFAIPMLASAFVLLVAIGFPLSMAPHSIPGMIFHYVANPVILLFTFGMLIAVAQPGVDFLSLSSLTNHRRHSGEARISVVVFVPARQLREIRSKLDRILPKSTHISPAFLLIVPSVWLFAHPPAKGSIAQLLTLSFYAVVVVILCTRVSPAIPGWINRKLILLGDASYSTYLFHTCVFAWIFPPILHLYTRFHHAAQAPIAFIVASVVACNLFGLVIHLAVERPLIRAIRKIPIGIPAGSMHPASVRPAYAPAGSGTLTPLSSTS